MLLTEFKEKFLNALIEIHSRQWASLEVFHGEEEKRFIIDVEALITSSMFFDKNAGGTRFSEIAFEWVNAHREFISTARLRQMIKKFGEISHTYETFQEKVEKRLFEKSRAEDKQISKKIPSKIPIFKPSLFQLWLRSVVGINARVEVFLYLLFHRGNSRQIASNVFYDQKNVYKILEKWKKAGIVVKDAGNYVFLMDVWRLFDRVIIKIKDYHPGLMVTYVKKDEKGFYPDIGKSPLPPFISWGRVFLLFHKIWNAIEMESWKNDEYMISSFFRNIFDEVQEIAIQVRNVSMNVHNKQLWTVANQLTTCFPERFGPGKRYFSPFAESLAEFMRNL